MITTFSVKDDIIFLLGNGEVEIPEPTEVVCATPTALSVMCTPAADGQTIVSVLDYSETPDTKEVFELFNGSINFTTREATISGPLDHPYWRGMVSESRSRVRVFADDPDEAEHVWICINTIESFATGFLPD